MAARNILLSTVLSAAALNAYAISSDGHHGPSYDCDKADGSVEELICNDSELSKLDLDLAHLYISALKATKGQEHRTLKAYQRGWIKGRNDCWKANNIRTCVLDEYNMRIKELTP